MIPSFQYHSSQPQSPSTKEQGGEASKAESWKIQEDLRMAICALCGGNGPLLSRGRVAGHLTHASMTHPRKSLHIAQSCWGGHRLATCVREAFPLLPLKPKVWRMCRQLSLRRSDLGSRQSNGRLPRKTWGLGMWTFLGEEGGSQDRRVHGRNDCLG